MTVDSHFRDAGLLSDSLHRRCSNAARVEEGGRRIKNRLAFPEVSRPAPGPLRFAHRPRQVVITNKWTQSSTYFISRRESIENGGAAQIQPQSRSMREIKNAA